MRLDKWLKVSRLIKRRTVANEACDNARVSANGRPVKASYDVKPGDVLELRFGERTVRVEVLAVDEHANKADVLDKLSDDGSGNLLFDGKRIDDGKVDVASTTSIDTIPANLRDGGLLIVNAAGA